MNFFEHQDAARRNTTRLVVLMLLAVASLIGMTTLVVAFFIYFFQFRSDRHAQAFDQQTDVFSLAAQSMSWELLAYVTFAVGAIVALGSVYKIFQLGSGGRTVAEALGGRLLNVDTRDADEKKVLNVVEEMAIASGTPVPPVYLIDDDSINAFAAGFKPRDAVIGVTRGSIRVLTRDELQGVIAHEFSHILNGDMRLNIRLVGILHGILVIGLLGYFLVRGGSRGAYVSSRGRRGNNAAAVFFAGLALMVIGYAGTFFGNLIKAAVSRQREFLADASAVQFTRNPGGIGGALKKIGGFSAGSMLQSAHAAEYSHLFFSQGVRTRFASLMATHPPLSERIKRIEPRWSGQFPRVESPTAARSTATSEAASAFAASPAPASTAASAVDSVGAPTEQHVLHAHQLLSRMPSALEAAAHEPFAARALVYSLLLDRHDEILRAKQWQSLRENAHPAVFKLVNQLAEAVAQLDRNLHLPLLELSMPALKTQSASQLTVFKRNLVALIKADRKIDWFEWALYRMVIHNLEPRRAQTATHTLNQLKAEWQLLLAVLATAGHHDSEAAQSSYITACKELGESNPLPLDTTAIQLPQVDRAIVQLNQLKPLQKPLLLKAMATCISIDNEVTPTEMELFRAIADSLDCPVPPLLPTQKIR